MSAIRIARGLAALALLPWCSGAFAAACTTRPVTITHSGTSPNANPNTLVFLDKTQYPAALCNDGSSPGFIIRQGIGASASRYLIHQQEGGECTDAATCAARSPLLTGSRVYGTPGHPNQTAVDTLLWGASAINKITALNNTGLLSPNATYNPDFWDATTVEVLYCSSDYSTGAHAAAGSFSRIDPNTWNFQGRGILQAVISTLKARYGLATATELLLAGSSAGGVGTVLNLNDVLPQISRPTRVVAMSDAGFYDTTYGAFDPNSTTSPYISSANPTLQQSTFAAGIQTWSGHGDALCASTAVTTAQQVQCYDTSYVIDSGYIVPPVFVAQGIYDTFQLGFNGIVPPYTAKSRAYITAFATHLDGKLTGVPAPTSAAIATGHYHTIMDNPQFTQVLFPAAAGGSQSLAALFGGWYRAPCTQVIATQSGVQ